VGVHLHVFFFECNVTEWTRPGLLRATSRLYIGTGLCGDEVTQQAFPLLPLAMSPPLSELLHTTLSVSRSGSVITASLTLGLVCVASYLRWRKRVALYPPGPPPDPILGNVRQLLKIDNQVQAFADWERLYGRLSVIRRVISPADVISVKGDINYLSVFNKSLLILNSLSAAKDLLEKRGAIYSSRPRLVMISEM